MAVKANQPVDATITITNAGSGGADTASVQLLGENGEALNGVGAVFCYLTKNADGSTVVTDSTDTSEIVIKTNGLYVEEVADVGGWLISESNGLIDLTITVITAHTAYLVLVMPDGRLVISSVMTYT